MAITDTLTEVGQAGSITTLSAPGKAVGATSINVASTTNWPANGKTVFFAIRKIDATLISSTNLSGIVPGTYTEWKGIVGSNTLTNLVLQTGSDQVYISGSNTQVLIPVNAPRENALVTWGSNQHNLDGTHAAVTATSVSSSGTLSATGATTLSSTLGVTGATTLTGAIGGTGYSLATITNPYKFSAVRGTSSALTSGTWTTVDTLTEDFDTSNNFNNTTGVFTAPISGFYQINASSGTTNAAGALQGMGLRILKNGSVGVIGGDTDFDNGVSYDYLRASISGLVQLTATNTFVLQGNLTITGGSVGLTNVRLSAFLVSAT